MTTLTLDPTQRLNVIAALDRLECQGRREAWAICALQKKFDLDDEERTIIGWRKMIDPDTKREFAMWSNAPALPPREYEVEDDDMVRIGKALDNYGVILARDRQWWEPLAAQLPIPQEQNGTQNAAVAVRN